MRPSGLWRATVLAAALLLASGQLCMLTTCVPRLQRASAAQAHSCCHAVPGSAASSSPRAPAPTGAMPCDQSLNLAGSPTLDAPAVAVLPLAIAADIASSATESTPIVLEPIERDTGPSPGRHTPAPTGLRAPPRA